MFTKTDDHHNRGRYRSRGRSEWRNRRSQGGVAAAGLHAIGWLRPGGAVKALLPLAGSTDMPSSHAFGGQRTTLLKVNLQRKMHRSGKAYIHKTHSKFPRGTQALLLWAQ